MLGLGLGVGARGRGRGRVRVGVRVRGRGMGRVRVRVKGYVTCGVTKHAVSQGVHLQVAVLVSGGRAPARDSCRERTGGAPLHLVVSTQGGGSSLAAATKHANGQVLCGFVVECALVVLEAAARCDPQRHHLCHG